MSAIVAVWTFLRAIPLRVWLLVALAIAAAVWIHRYGESRETAGANRVWAEWAAAIARDNAAAIERAETRAEVTEKIVVEYVDRVREVRGKTIEIIKEVPRYVSIDDCSLSGGFRMFHDWAVMPTGKAPDAASGADAAPVAAQALAGTISENYGACHANAVTLEALQEWERRQGEVR